MTKAERKQMEMCHFQERKKINCKTILWIKKDETNSGFVLF